MKHLPLLINFIAGLLLLILGLSGYAAPEWFFTHKYDVLMPTPQSNHFKSYDGLYGRDWSLVARSLCVIF